jgi:hypothetical protein
MQARVPEMVGFIELNSTFINEDPFSMNSTLFS